MKKLLLLLLVQMLFAHLVDAVAIVIEDEPIMLSDIEHEMKNGLSKQEAIERLIGEALKTIKIKELGIEVSDMDVQARIELVAKSNGLDPQDFLRLVQQRQSVDEYKKGVKEALVNELLFRSILAGEMPVSEDELRTHYDANSQKFQQAKYVDIVQYVSLNKHALQELARNPLVQDESIVQKEQSVDLQAINPNLARLLQETSSGQFTDIFEQKGRFFMFFVKKKRGVSTQNFALAAPKVREELLAQKRKRAVEDYFMRQRSTARIIMLRQ